MSHRTRKTTCIRLEEYKEDIANIFVRFTYGDRNFMDLNILEQVFIALENPLTPEKLHDVKGLVLEKGLPGVPYDLFESIYLEVFPYNSNSLLKEAFDIFDVNHTGQITLEDMLRIKEKLLLKFTDEEFKDIIHLFDENDSAITFDAVMKEYD